MSYKDLLTVRPCEGDNFFAPLIHTFRIKMTKYCNFVEKFYKVQLPFLERNIIWGVVAKVVRCNRVRSRTKAHYRTKFCHKLATYKLNTKTHEETDKKMDRQIDKQGYD